MASIRNYQLAVEVETQLGEGIPGTLVTNSALAKFLVIDPTFDGNPNLTPRNTAGRSSFTKPEDTAGFKEATITFQLEMSGTTLSAAGEPKPVWGNLLRACGMQEVETHSTRVGGGFTVAQQYFHGEVITQGANEAVVIHDTYEDTTGSAEVTLFHTQPVVTATGADAAFVVTTPIVGADSGTSSVPAAGSQFAGWSYYPTSQPEITLAVADGASVIAANTVVYGQTSGCVAVLLEATTATMATDSQLARLKLEEGNAENGGEVFSILPPWDAGAPGATTFTATASQVQAQIPTLRMALFEDGPVKRGRGCRGTFSVQGDIGQAAIMSFEFQGLWGSPVDAQPHSSVAYESPVPPVLLGATVRFADDDQIDQPDQFVPCLNSFSFDIGNTIALSSCMNETAGIRYASITDRNPTSGYDPEVRAEGVFDFIAKMRTGEPFATRIEWGTAELNKFVVTMPTNQISSEGKADRDGIAVRDLSCVLRGGIRGGAEQSDNELVITLVEQDPL